MKKRAKPKRQKYSYEVAPDVQEMLEDIVRHLQDDFSHVDTNRVLCYRSKGSTANIYARIWSFPGIWQAALGVEAHYVIEVVERFDRESRAEQEKTLIHELMHIPKTFSGNLVPHKCFGKTIDCNSENKLYERLQLARAVEARARASAGLKAKTLAVAVRGAPTSQPTSHVGQQTLDLN